MCLVLCLYISYSLLIIRKLKEIMVDEDNFLWKVLNILGIRISIYNLKPYEKYLSYIVRILGSSFILYWISAALFNAIKHGIFNVGKIVYTLIMPFQLIVFWHFLNMQKENISAIIKKLYSYKKRYARDNNQTYYVKFFTMAFILIPGIISLIFTVSEKQVFSIWSYGYKINDKIIIYIFSFYVTFMYYSCTMFIVLITFTMSILFLKWGEILRKYNMLLSIYFKKRKVNGKIHFLKEFFYIVKILQNLDQFLESISFFIIFYGLEMIFFVFHYAILHRDKLFKTSYMIEVVFSGICGFFIVVVYSLSSSTIPEKLTEIRKTSKYCIAQYGKDPRIDRNVLFYLSRIEKEDIVYITGCRMFSLNRQFILSAIGVTLTYDLLLIDFK